MDDLKMKAVEDFIEFTDGYVDAGMLCDYPAFGYKLEQLKAAIRPQQLEFAFIADLGREAQK